MRLLYEEKTVFSRGQSAHNVCAVLDLGGLLLATVRGFLYAFPEALLHHFPEPHTRSGEACLYCSRWHSQEMCSFANAQALDIAQLEGLGTYAELVRNWLALMQAAGLTTHEWMEASALFAARIGVLGPRYRIRRETWQINV